MTQNSDEEERDSVKVTASCEKKDISSHLEPGIISAFTTACETDTLSDFQQLPSDEEKCAEMGRSSVLSENGIKHLLVWMSGAQGMILFLNLPSISKMLAFRDCQHLGQAFF